MEEKNRVTATGIALELENLQILRLGKQTVKAELCRASLCCDSSACPRCGAQSPILPSAQRAADASVLRNPRRRRLILMAPPPIVHSLLQTLHRSHRSCQQSRPISHAPRQTFHPRHRTFHTGATEVVNGLVCFYKANLASVFNLSTREIMCLPYFSDANPKPKTKTKTKTKPKTLNYNYYFGYASSCNEYKLLKLYNVIGGREWEFLTLGKDASWRRPSSRADAPPIDLKRNRSSVYIDGALCCWHKKISNSVILLDYADESWQLVDLPPQIAEPYCWFLLPLRSRFAVASPIDRCFQLDIWVLEGGRGGGGPSPLWTNHFIIDTVIGFPDFDCFIGNLPTGEVLLSFSGMNFPIYAFDPTNGRSEVFEIGMFPSAPHIAYRIHAYYYEEDMTPLRHRISNKLQIMSSRDTPHVKINRM
ncbi:hypothetical protein Acr_00g0087410 [Actinidia rufa]|uniref:F-box associated beta-propeller type 3 domain-containing protein n=1 Tax=Actinidia rufa TaxID=165716 RepID=A0A7J0DX97_9ERIC|nr:hypothetical protein Acr_00g0087410 [Actinidia rufa]